MTIVEKSWTLALAPRLWVGGGDWSLSIADQAIALATELLASVMRCLLSAGGVRRARRARFPRPLREARQVLIIDHGESGGKAGDVGIDRVEIGSGGRPSQESEGCAVGDGELRSQIAAIASNPAA